MVLEEFNAALSNLLFGAVLAFIAFQCLLARPTESNARRTLRRLESSARRRRCDLAIELGRAHEVARVVVWAIVAVGVATVAVGGYFVGRISTVPGTEGDRLMLLFVWRWVVFLGFVGFAAYAERRWAPALLERVRSLAGSGTATTKGADGIAGTQLP